MFIFKILIQITKQGNAGENLTQQTLPPTMLGRSTKAKINIK